MASVELFGGATGFDAVVPDGSFVSLGAKDATNNTQEITFAQTRFSERREVVTFTTTGGGAAFDREVVLHQLGATPTLTLSTTSTSAPDISAITAVEGTITANITIGGGASGWVATLEDPDGFFESVTPLKGDRTVTSVSITYNENVGLSRRAKLVFSSVGRVAQRAIEALEFTQFGGAPTISVSTRPSDLTTLPTAPEGSTVNILAIITLGGGAEGWSVTKSGDDADVVIADFSPMQGDRTNNRLLITYNVSMGILRTATLTIATTGGTGAVATADLVLTHMGETPHTLVPSSTYRPALIGGKLSAGRGTITTDFTLGGGAEGWEATESLDYVSLTPSSGDASESVVITYKANDAFDEREVRVAITTTGTTGVAAHGGSHFYAIRFSRANGGYGSP